MVLTLWQDEFVHEKGRIIYQATLEGARTDWSKFPGNSERIENLKWAWDHCGGFFHVVIAIPKDPHSPIREIAECFPHPKLRMRIVDLNEETGEFRAMSVSS